MIEAAIAYRNAGFSVVPLHERDYFHCHWRTYSSRLPTLREVRKWWLFHPGADVAIVPGKVSDLLVVEVDEARGQDAWQRLLPQLPPTYIQRNPTHYTRLWYRWRDVESCGELWPGIRLLADGCQPFPAFPSREIKENGALQRDDRAVFPELSLPRNKDAELAAGWFGQSEVQDITEVRGLISALVGT